MLIIYCKKCGVECRMVQNGFFPLGEYNDYDHYTNTRHEVEYGVKESYPQEPLQKVIA